MEPGALILGADFLAIDPREIPDFGFYWIAAKWKPIADWLNGARPTVEPIIWVVGSVLALIPGSFAIYKWIYFRRSRLPQRFEEMLVEEEKRLKEVRGVLLERIQRPESTKSFKAPIFLESSLAKAVRALRWSRWWSVKTLTVADENLRTALDEIDIRLRGGDELRARQLDQKATALLLRGAIAAASAEREHAAGKGGDGRSREALSYFLAALEIDPTDPEALEYAAHQHRALHEVDNAIGHYKRLGEQSDKPDPRSREVRTRALRYVGEMYERRYDAYGVVADLTRAKEALDEAINIMPQAARGELLEAFTLRWSGSVEDKRGTVTLWESRYAAAERTFSDLIIRSKDVREATAGRNEISRLRAEAINRRAQQQPTEPAAPTRPPLE